MSKPTKRKCPGCQNIKSFRADQKTCGCKVNPELVEASTVKGDSWEIHLPKSRIHTLADLIKFFEIDESIWEIERFVANKWEMGYTTEDKNGNKVGNAEPLYQVKAFLKKKNSVAKAKLEIESLKRLALEQSAKPLKVVKPKTCTGAMLEINLTDHHFGKLAWGAETGWANYDVKIATKLFHRAVETILARSPFETYEEIWFIVGNDLFNSDDTLGRTTSGTQVESDVRHEKTYVTVRTLLVQAIERFRGFAKKVKTIVVSGNHDYNTTWHIGDSLQCYFAKYPDVEVDNRPLTRKYHRYGNALIGYTHGDKGKQKDLPLLMTVEAKELYALTKFHEWHTGHKHQKFVGEEHGIRVRILSSLCSPDAWHGENGYVGNLRESEAFVWDKVEGIINIIVYTDSDDLIESASENPSK